MTIVSGNPLNISIQVLGSEVNVSEIGFNELKKLIKE